MTEEEADLIHRVQELYWTAFSKLVAKHLQMVPPKLRGHMLVVLEEHSSVHGSGFDKYMKPK